MRFRVFHRTRYLYRAPVRDSYNELRLRPATDDKSRLEFFLLKIHPPARLQHFRDNWFNYVHFSEVPEAHTSLTIESQSTINTTSPYQDGKPLGVRFETLKTALDDMLQPFLGGSKYVDVSPEVWRLGIDIRDGSDHVFEVAEAVMHHIFREWTYAPNSTNVSTHMNEVLATKRGVCQDFAHLAIASMRAMGLPARYISGYLRTHPPVGKPRLVGVDASHAWASCFVPRFGWVDFDPTNDCFTSLDHITVAYGRDFSDVSPVRGIITGGGHHTVGVGVDVEPLGT
jgi:transglutaminase-like putative cysteine protease